MLFSSVVFIFFFLPVAIAGYYLLRFSRNAQNIWLLLASLFFYAWGQPVFVPVLILSILFNYFTARSIDGARGGNPEKAHKLMLAACAVNLGLLFVCKHLVTIVRDAVGFFGYGSGFLDALPFPLGMSFFTLQAVSYIIDTYRGKTQAAKNPLHTAMHIAFFPKLISGPLMSYSDMDGQITNRRETWEGFSAGVCRFITGLAKKVLIADSMASIADHTFNYSAMSNEITQVPVLLAWIGAVAFVLQIYFDLSGYSDMAVGLGLMFGFRLNENFDYPYTAASINDFWRRWHISLTGWFREYIYQPLGGSNVSNNDKMVRNLLAVWAVTGIWHGAKATFILWGIWQLFFIVLERAIEFESRRIPAFFRHVYVLAAVLFGFVIFRTNDIYQLTVYVSNMLGTNHNGFFSDTALMFAREYWAFFAAGVLFSMPVAGKLSDAVKSGRAGRWGGVLSTVYPAVMLVAFYIAAAYLIRRGSLPFIYFSV